MNLASITKVKCQQRIRRICTNGIRQIVCLCVIQSAWLKANIFWVNACVYDNFKARSKEIWETHRFEKWQLFMDYVWHREQLIDTLKKWQIYEIYFDCATIKRIIFCKEKWRKKNILISFSSSLKTMLPSTGAPSCSRIISWTPSSLGLYWIRIVPSKLSSITGKSIFPLGIFTCAAKKKTRNQNRYDLLFHFIQDCIMDLKNHSFLCF